MGTGQQEIALKVEQAAMASMRALYIAAPSSVATELRLDLLDIGSTLVARSAVWNTPHVNRIFGLGVMEAANEALLDELATFFQTAGVRYALGLSPIARPSELAQWLTTRGFVHMNNTAVLHRSVEPLQSQTALRIECIDSTSAMTFAALLLEAFPLPQFFGSWLAATVGRAERRHYLAFDGATPVAAAMMFLHEKVGVLEFAATLESHRQQGAQRALIARRIQDAAALGCTLVVTTTEEDTLENPSRSFRNLQKAGFQVTYLRPDYLSPPIEELGKAA